jgi:hypothetical protein
MLKTYQEFPYVELIVKKEKCQNNESDTLIKVGVSCYFLNYIFPYFNTARNCTV